MRIGNRGRNDDGSPNKIDVHVGNRLRLRRMMLGFSQEQLGMLVGITFQQIQKYERGTNRISASRLWDFSKVLRVPISFFYAEMSDETMSGSPRMLENNSGSKQKCFCYCDDPMYREETLLLLNALERISDEDVRQSFIQMIKALGK